MESLDNSFRGLIQVFCIKKEGKVSMKKQMKQIGFYEGLPLTDKNSF